MTPASVSGAYFFFFEFFIIAFGLFDYCEYLGHQTKSVPGRCKQRKEVVVFFYEMKFFLLSSNSF